MSELEKWAEGPPEKEGEVLAILLDSELMKIGELTGEQLRKVQAALEVKIQDAYQRGDNEELERWTQLADKVQAELRELEW